MAGRQASTAGHVSAGATDHARPTDGARTPPTAATIAGSRCAADASADRLTRKDNLYDFIIEIDHNTRPRVAGRGSAVFIHAARKGFAPTAGCIALELSALRKILSRLGPHTRIVVE